MRERVDRGRDLHARGGESARLPAGRRSLSAGPRKAEIGATAIGERSTQTEIRFTAGEKLQSALQRGARGGDARRASRISGAAVKRGAQVRFGSIVDRSSLFSAPDVEHGEDIGQHETKRPYAPVACTSDADAAAVLVHCFGEVPNCRRNSWLNCEALA